ncbi:MAG: hypothetical protein J5965_28145 [Aeriscardovia sp.]|nr:hypothetical protein [Aeriscardovia sp.]
MSKVFLGILTPFMIALSVVLGVLIYGGISWLVIAFADFVFGTAFMSAQNVAILALIIWVAKLIGGK